MNKKIKKKINISFYFENKKEDSQHIFGFLKKKKEFCYFLFSLFLLKIPKIKNQSELKLIFVSYLYLFIYFHYVWKINEVLLLRIARYAKKNLILLIIDTLLIMFYINKLYLEFLENPRT